MGVVNDPEEEEEEENVTGNRTQPARNPVGGSHGWEKENAPASSPITQGFPGGAAGILKKQATMFPEEGNVPRVGTTSH